MARVKSHKTTKAEMKEIIELYEQGFSVKEIQAITGRGREAQSRIIASVGLGYENNYRSPESKAWFEAENYYDNERCCNKSSKLYNFPKEFRDLKPTDRYNFYMLFIDKYKDEARALYNDIMGTSTSAPKVNKDSVIAISDILDYCKEHESEDRNLYKFIIPGIIKEIVDKEKS